MTAQRPAAGAEILAASRAPSRRPVILTAATTWEAKPLIRQWGLSASTGGGEAGLLGRRPRRENRGGGAAGVFEGRAEARDIVLVRTGIGREKTARALAGLDAGPDFLAISSGLAGALQPGIRSGDLVADLREAPLEAVEAARAAAAALGWPLHLGAFHTADAVITDPADKRELGRRLRAAAVDMESAAVRDWCRARGGVFLGLRAVLDELDQRLPDWPCEDESPRALARFAASHWAQWPELAGLGWRTRRATSRLARFLDEWLRRFDS